MYQGDCAEYVYVSWVFNLHMRVLPSLHPFHPWSLVGQTGTERVQGLAVAFDF